MLMDFFFFFFFKVISDKIWGKLTTDLLTKSRMLKVFLKGGWSALHQRSQFGRLWHYK